MIMKVTGEDGRNHHRVAAITVATKMVITVQNVDIEGAGGVRLVHHATMGITATIILVKR